MGNAGPPVTTRRYRDVNGYRDVKEGATFTFVPEF